MLYAIVAVVALILDQAVKYWTTVHIAVDSGSSKLIPGLIHLANVHNTGAAFSFLEGARWLFVVLCILFVALIVYVLAKDIIRHRLARWMAVLVAAGAVGNCIDRIVCGYVVDMFEFDFLFFGKPFPVFNVADIFITVGAIIFCVCILLEKPKKGGEKQPAGEKSGAVPVAAEKKAPRKPLIPPRKKQPAAAPSRPAAQPRPQPAAQPQPAADPNDPFAEWDRRAAASRQNTTVYTQPVPPAAKPEPAAPAVAPVTRETPPAPVQRVTPPAPVQRETPPAPKTVAAPTASMAPAAPAKPAAESYNLDDILAEFKDL